MEILGSSQYQKDRARPWMQLSVINIWDFKTKAICFQGEGAYTLQLVTPISLTECRVEFIKQPTEEMKNAIVNMGYTLSNNI